MVKISPTGSSVFDASGDPKQPQIAAFLPEIPQVFEIIVFVDLVREWCKLLLREIEDRLTQLKKGDNMF